MTDTTDISTVDSDDRHQGGIQVISRMSRIMRVLSSNPQPQGMSLAAIAAQVDLPRSTVQRIITALVAENMVEPAGASGFRIGPALGQMLYQTHSDIVPVLKPYVEQLSLKLQETVCLLRMQTNKLHAVDAVIAEQVLRVVPQIGMTPPPHLTAPGKALLAQMDDASLQEWIKHYDSPELISSAQLLEEIAEVRRQGFAMDVDQVLQGVAAMAISIGTYRGAYSICILAPTARMQMTIEKFKQELFELRDAIEKILAN